MFCDLGTTTPHSRKSEPRPSQFRPLTTEATARKQSFSLRSRGVRISSRIWRSSTKSVKRTKRLPTSFRKSPRTRKPTEFEIQTPRWPASSLVRLRWGSYRSQVVQQESCREVQSYICQPKRGKHRNTPILETQTLEERHEVKRATLLASRTFQPKDRDYANKSLSRRPVRHVTVKQCPAL